MNIFSIVIPAHNEELYIADCIRSILDASVPSEYSIEIIVVDNDSSDQTPSRAAQFPQVRVIHESRRGTNFARQAGASRARGSLIGFIDADNRIPSDWIIATTKLFTANPTLVLVSGPYRFYDASLRHKRISTFYWHIAAVLARITGVMAVGGNMVIKKDALDSIGGFDTSITFYGDDTDIARRLRRVGTVLFRTNLWLFSSARRLKKHGLLVSGFLYVVNYFSELIFHRPATNTHENIRN
ncbi:MAG: hypothetical protein RIQ54_276 [Candidatus Parcubacteria bacterium]|jgi:glycosyltransferase involved in cell wall biosynthesis